VGRPTHCGLEWLKPGRTNVSIPTQVAVTAGGSRRVIEITIFGDIHHTIHFGNPAKLLQF
jgi:hypothetical protein